MYHYTHFADDHRKIYVTRNRIKIVANEYNMGYDGPDGEYNPEVMRQFIKRFDGYLFTVEVDRPYESGSIVIDILGDAKDIAEIVNQGLGFPEKWDWFDKIVEEDESELTIPN